MSIEKVIFANLVYNEQYARQVIPFLKADYFSDYVDKTVYDLIDTYFLKYNTTPTVEALSIDLENKSLNEDAFKKSKELISDLKFEKSELQWLLDKTEKFCQEKSVYNAIMKSIQILDNKNVKEKDDKGAIPQILSDALGISFDTHIGHDFLDDAETRFEFYNKKHSRIPFSLDYFNKITQGGLPNKTLNICLAGTGAGKSLFMCQLASDNLTDGKNVLYITLEMAEEEIAKRIDSNLLDIPMDEIAGFPKEMYDRKIARIKSKTTGKLVIKEYPTTCAGSANFRHLLNELKIKKNFKPDIIYIDYINICMS